VIRRSILFRSGTFLVDGKFELCSVRVANGKIKEIDVSLIPRPGERVVDLEGLHVIPAFINAHDHLEFNLYPRLGSPPYRNYVDWARDIQKNDQDLIQRVLRVPLRLRLLWGAYKNIISGVSTVIHHNPYFYHFRYRYPVHVFKEYDWIHSIQLDDSVATKIRKRHHRPLLIHLAEGIDELMASELSKLDGMGGLTKDTILIHGVGLTKADAELLIAKGGGVVWCPTSNEYLFGKTAPVNMLLGKIPVVLGTDSCLTGSRSLFEEMRYAKRAGLDPHKILAMVTSEAASLFGLNEGRVAPGAQANFLGFQMAGSDPFERIATLSPSEIELLTYRGVATLGSEKFRHLFKRNSTPIRLDGIHRIVVGDLPSILRKIRALLPSWNSADFGLESTS